MAAVLQGFAGVVVSYASLGNLGHLFGRGWFSFSTPVLARGVIQLHIGIVGNVGVRGVADSVYSKWWGHELCGRGCGAGCGGTCVVGSAAETSSVGLQFLGASCSQLDVVEEICG